MQACTSARSIVRTHGNKAWKLFEDLARNGLLVPGPNNAALNPVLTGAKKATISGVDYISYGQIAKGEKLSIITCKKEPWSRCPRFSSSKARHTGTKPAS